MRDYIARDPRTGKPLRAGKRRRKNLDLAYKPAEGAWDSIPLDRILPLARGEIELHSVYWRDKERLLRQQDAVRALPRIRGRDYLEAHAALQSALGSLDPRLRIAGLSSLPYCALSHTETLFEHLHELLDDVDEDVAECSIIQEEKCEDVTQGYTTEQKCTKWPVKKCETKKQKTKKYSPQTACKKVPREVCGAGSIQVPGEEECFDRKETALQEVK